MTKISQFTNQTAAQLTDELVAQRGTTNSLISARELLQLGRVALGMSAVAVSKTDANTTETTLASVAVPAGTLGVNDALHVVSRWTFPNSATTKTFAVKFGGTVFQRCSGQTNNTQTFELYISNRNSLTSQIGWWDGTTGVWGISGYDFVLGTVNTANALNVDFTATWGTAGTGTNSIKLESYLVEVLRA